MVALRNVIKSEKPVDFFNIEASTLTFYKVSFSYDESIKNALMGPALNYEKPLSLLNPLFEIFPETPLKKHMHIVVEAPLSSKSYYSCSLWHL